MKQSRYITLVLAILLQVPVVFGQENKSPSISFRVEKGDTFSNLFGSDWQKGYQQNRITIFRRGRPLTSPDIMIEGMVVRVSSDVALSPRAVARCGEFRARREHLSAELKALERQLADNPEARGLLFQTHQLLDDDLHFAADADFAARQIQYLQAIAKRKVIVSSPPPTAVDGSKWRMYAAVGLVALVILAAAFCVAYRKQRPQFPEADARYKEALSDLKATYRGMERGRGR